MALASIVFNGLARFPYGLNRFSNSQAYGYMEMRPLDGASARYSSCKNQKKRNDCRNIVDVIIDTQDYHTRTDQLNDPAPHSERAKKVVFIRFPN